MRVSVQYAHEHFADLIAVVSNGEDVEIALSGKPSLRLSLANASSAPALGPRILGAGRGELRVPDESEWKAMDQELERQMNNAPLFPSDSSPSPERM